MVDLAVRTKSNLYRFYGDRERFYDHDLACRSGVRVRIGREAKDAPREIQALATKIGGLNFLGEPNFRIVWGWSRLCIIAGEWTDCDSAGNYLRTVGQYRWEPKYMPFDRWHLEKWLPPEHFGPRSYWHEITKEIFNGVSFAALGPFPSRGEYEHCFTIEDQDGSYLPLSPYVVETVILAIEQSRAQDYRDRREARERREEAKKKEADDFAFDLADDAYPAFYGKPNVSVTRQIEKRKEDE